ncbi:hypothetical protein [Reyranella soli]|uniref:hypothetical protein n=1 Tax=Reyranella soli TaxID=1230389 RepID=UPI0011BDC625|nr:hypothetical protein [Reyranella soli]
MTSEALSCLYVYRPNSFGSRPTTTVKTSATINLHAPFLPVVSLTLLVDIEANATEADVELQVIAPLLTSGSCLEIPHTSIKGKSYLAPSVLDKAGGKARGYFPDFSIWELGFAVMVVEAKAPGVPVEVGFREAQLYARHLNAEYKSGLNPCHYILASNGKQVAYGAWDTNRSRVVNVADLKPGTIELEAFVQFCHHRVLLAHAQRCLATVRFSRSTQPHTLAGGQALINSKKAFNSFAAELAPTLRRYFTSTTQNDDPDIYQKAYVGSDDVTEYDRILEALLKDRLTSRRPMSEELSPTKAKEPKLAKAISEFRRDRPAAGQLQLITGSVGTGKSLFTRRYKELLQPEDQKKGTHWAFINFNSAPEPLETAHDWLCQQFVDSFHHENPQFDPYANENLTRIFSEDLQKRRGIYDEVEKRISLAESEKTRISDLQEWQKDPRRVALGICRHFTGQRQEAVVVVMDNVDRLDLQSQLGAFTLSLWFLDQSKAFVILQMRDETYERFKNSKPLDTFRSGVVFHIAPPRFLDVVKRRLELSLEYLSRNSPDVLEYQLGSGMRIRYPKSMLGEFLRSIYLELFDRRHNVSRILQGLAGRDIRRALEMFVSILNSGHLREEALTSSAVGAQEIAISEYRILRILMRTEYRFFNNNSGFVSNIFYFDDDWQQPNSFILPEILFWLSDNRKRRGQIGLEGYFSVSNVADELQRRGYVREDVCQACSWLLQKNLIEADHMNQTLVDFADSIKVTAAGFIHLRVLCERLEYLYGVLTVTPISDLRTATAISDYLRRENQTGYISGFQQVRAVELFLEYLKRQFAQLKAAYPEFGHDRAGAAYMIRQVESTVRYFRNPTNQERSRNYLDE